MDKMEASLFLYTTDNAGDGLYYEIIPVKHISKIPKYRNPVTLVHIVVRSRVIEFSDTPRLVESKEGFKFFNRPSDELFRTDEIEPLPSYAI